MEPDMSQAKSNPGGSFPKKGDPNIDPTIL